MSLYHLTDDVSFRLDPNFRPENNTTLGGDWPEPGIFLAPDIEHWVNGYGYWRPWVVEFEVPSSVMSSEGVGQYGREVFIPARYFGQIRITRVLPLDGYAREVFGEWGWTEEWFETTYDTFEPISEDELQGRFPWRGYRSPDARQMGGSWHSQYSKRVRDYMNKSGRAGGVYGHLREAWGSLIRDRDRVSWGHDDEGYRHRGDDRRAGGRDPRGDGSGATRPQRGLDSSRRDTLGRSRLSQKFTVSVTPSAIRDYMGLDEQTKRQIRRAVQSLWQSSTPSGHARLSTGDHRLRVGDYRIVYGITGTHSVVFLIAHRREVYQRMRRR